MRPSAIIKRYGLKNPIFSETAAYGHMGRKPGKKTVLVGVGNRAKKKVVKTFAWEELDYVIAIQKAFKLK